MAGAWWGRGEARRGGWVVEHTESTRQPTAGERLLRATLPAQQPDAGLALLAAAGRAGSTAAPLRPVAASITSPRSRPPLLAPPLPAAHCQRSLPPGHPCRRPRCQQPIASACCPKPPLRVPLPAAPEGTSGSSSSSSCILQRKRSVTPRMYSLGCCRLFRKFWQMRICSRGQRNKAHCLDTIEGPHK